MDIVLLRTFLELNRTHHFGKAADNLCITQSTMSSRIRQLEELLGQSLFTRERNNIQLTSAGQRLLPHAEGILSAWQRTRVDVAMEEEQIDMLSIGGMFSLWDIYIQNWLHQVRTNMPNLSLYTDAMGAAECHRALLEHRLDLSFVFEAVHHNELTILELPLIDLVLVSSTQGQDMKTALTENYILVDWGTSVNIRHARHFPNIPTPKLHMSMGRNALSCLLAGGGSAYLARTMVDDALKNETLFIVNDAPVIKRSCYAIYHTNSEKLRIIENVLDLF
ncbi:MAG: LysR family transcriptional regulator [Gammaproteobacteria bacterium]|nr:LysR family transcriptional regulator [Gammaproteobacteria bacterium]